MCETSAEMKEPAVLLDQDWEKNVPWYEELSDEEKREVASIEAGIDLHRVNAVTQYGLSLQNQMKEEANQVLEHVSAAKVEEAAETVLSLFVQMQSVADFSCKENKFLRLFSTPEKKALKIKKQYDKAVQGMHEDVLKLKQSRIPIKKDIEWYNKMYGENLALFHSLSLHIIAGERKINEMEGSEGSQVDICDKLEKRIIDLKSTRTLSAQMPSQLHLLQNYERKLAEQIQSALDKTIPLWKSQIPLALGCSNEKADDQMLTVDLDMLRQLNQTMTEALHGAIMLRGESLKLQPSIKDELSKMHKY